MFARAANERTRHDSSWTGWTTLGGMMAGGPAAIPLTAIVSSAFVDGTDNGAWQKTITDAGAASGWTDAGGRATCKPGAAIGPGANA